MSGHLFDPLSVACVVEAGSHGHQPELGDLGADVSDLDTLRWYAGIIEAEVEIRVRIHHSRPGRFGLTYLNVSHGDRSFDDTWKVLVGFLDGATAARRAFAAELGTVLERMATTPPIDPRYRMTRAWQEGFADAIAAVRQELSR